MEEELRDLQVQRDAAQARLDEVSRKLEAEEEAKQKAEEAAKKLAEEVVFRQVHCFRDQPPASILRRGCVQFRGRFLSAFLSVVSP